MGEKKLRFFPEFVFLLDEETHQLKNYAWAVMNGLNNDMMKRHIN